MLVLLGPFPEEKSSILKFIAFLFAYAASFYALVVYVGLSFNTYRKQSWFRHLSFAASTILATALSVICAASIWYFVTLIDIWQSGYLFVGTSIVELLFLMPFFNFFVIRRSKNPLLGGFVAGLVSFVFILCHAFIFSEWNVAQYGLIAELPYIVLLVICAALLEKESRLSAVFFASLTMVFPLMMLLPPDASEPQTLRNVLLNLKIYPTAEAIQDFRDYTTNAKHWRSEPGMQAIKWTINDTSTEFAKKFLTDEETKEFLRNILNHAENFAIMEPNRQPYSYSNPFPLKPEALSPSAINYLMETWRDNDAYCYYLPHKVEKRFVEVAATSKSCFAEFIQFFTDQPYPHLSAEQMELLDSYLTKPRSDMPREIADAIGRLIINNTNFPDSIKQTFIDNDWFKKTPLTDETLKVFKKYFLYNRRKQIASWLSLDRNGFVKAIRQASLVLDPHDRERDDYEFYTTLKYLCTHVSQECSDKPTSEERASFSYVFKKNIRIWRLSGRRSAEARWMLAREILKPEHWPKLEKLSIMDY